MKKYNVAIVGAGLIGNKRALAIRETKIGLLSAVADSDLGRLSEFSEKYQCQAYSDWHGLILNKNIDIVIVAVPNQFAKEIVIEALKQGKHVLCEKPFGRNLIESSLMLEVSKKYQRLIKVGFNHRFHPGIFKAKQLFDEGLIGKPLFIRARYGHGGRLGMEKEWRFNKKVSGGGELLDQGVHLVDLCRWFVGDFKSVYGVVDTKFWKIHLEDNAFFLMRRGLVTASCHVSTTNWKNIFSFEISGDLGYLTIEGLGGSYGLETLTIGKRKPQFGVPDVEIIRFLEDSSWREEWRNFISAILGGKSEIANGVDGYENNRIIEAIYLSSKKREVINL